MKKRTWSKEEKLKVLSEAKEEGGQITIRNIYRQLQELIDNTSEDPRKKKSKNLKKSVRQLQRNQCN